jgi:hypothetical protein
MNALLLAALLATPPGAAAAPDETDLRCYRLMAELAQAEDSEARRVGLIAAQFFLGRIDAAAPGYEVGTAAREEAGRTELLRRCGAVLDAGGFDPREAGTSLEGREPTI